VIKQRAFEDFEAGNGELITIAQGHLDFNLVRIRTQLPRDSIHSIHPSFTAPRCSYYSIVPLEAQLLAFPIYPISTQTWNNGDLRLPQFDLLRQR